MNNFKVKVNFYQCDPEGILFFANIFQICHSAYEDLINSFQLEESYFINAKYAVPLVNCSADYKKMIKYNEMLDINIKVTKLLNHSFELEYSVFSANVLKAVVKTAHVFINKGTLKKMDIPAEIAQKLSLLAVD
ncbi:MAG: thioesterase family protein [Bacteroidota bacterium]|nr:thioesterase family protein [Bacteroidota bacterium]